jgi:Ion channel
MLEPPMDAHPLTELLVLLAGAALVLAAATDAVSTLVTTQRRSSRWWPTYVFYRRTWRTWRALGRRIPSERGRERLLAVYGPLSLLGLLVLWVVLLVAGWGLVWWVLAGQLSGVGGYLDALYFAGVGFFTVGFGDVVPVGGPARLLALAQAFMGLVSIALVIGFLPTLFGAYSRREVQLLTLDDLSAERTTSTGLVEAWHADGGLPGLAAAFADWERWCAEVFDSHTAYPMLALFRSRQPGQHWLTALGVVTDAAAIYLATVQGASAGPAARLYRRATGLLRTVGILPAVASLAADAGSGRLGDDAAFQALYRRLEGHGVPLRPYDAAWADLQRLRTEYLPYLRATTRLLLVPPEFRNQAAPGASAPPWVVR